MTLTRFLPGGRTARLLVALTMTASLAACSSADNGDSDGDAAMPQAETVDSLASASELGETAKDSSAPAERPAARAPASTRSVISTGTISLTSDDVAQARRDVQRVIDSQQGTISEEKTETDDDGAATYSRLVIRVPASSFAATMLALEKTAEIRRSQIGSEDVTTQVIDTDVRVRAQEASLRRIEQLLARATSLKDIVWIETQLTQRQSELDSLKSQQAWLADQTSESTITVDIERNREATSEKKKDEDTGFLAGLKGGMKALGATTAAVATIIGALLPFAVVLAFLGVPLWLLMRRSVRRRPVEQPATT